MIFPNGIKRWQENMKYGFQQIPRLGICFQSASRQKLLRTRLSWDTGLPGAWKHQASTRASPTCFQSPSSSSTTRGETNNAASDWTMGFPRTLKYYPQLLSQLQKSISTQSKSPDNPGSPLKAAAYFGGLKNTKQACHSRYLVLIPALSICLPVFSHTGQPCLWFAWAILPLSELSYLL